MAVGLGLQVPALTLQPRQSELADRDLPTDVETNSPLSFDVSIVAANAFASRLVTKPRLRVERRSGVR